MPAPNGSIRAIRVVFVKTSEMSDGEIRGNGKGNVHRCVSTRSNNFGADRTVTVPAMASRIRVMRDMIVDSSDLS